MVFRDWAAWAGGRHFMVFRGHYLRWLEDYFECRSDRTHLVGVVQEAGITGIFGWETWRGFAQVTIAKHTPALSGRELWVAGLQAIGSMPTLCGSTADVLKEQLGLEPHPSWLFDTSKLGRKETGQ